MCVKGDQLPTKSDLSPDFVREKKICIFADVENCQNSQRGDFFYV